MDNLQSIAKLSLNYNNLAALFTTQKQIITKYNVYIRNKCMILGNYLNLKSYQYSPRSLTGTPLTGSEDCCSQKLSKDIITYKLYLKK
jgi:hypothetical protein